MDRKRSKKLRSSAASSKDASSAAPSEAAASNSVAVVPVEAGDGVGARLVSIHVMVASSSVAHMPNSFSTVLSQVEQLSSPVDLDARQVCQRCANISKSPL